MCGFVQDKSDKFDWTRHSGTTSSSNTGPSSDHTGKSGRLLKENFLPVQYPIFVLFSFLPPISGNSSYLKSFSNSRAEILQKVCHIPILNQSISHIKYQQVK